MPAEPKSQIRYFIKDAAGFADDPPAALRGGGNPSTAKDARAFAAARHGPPVSYSSCA